MMLSCSRIGVIQLRKRPGRGTSRFTSRRWMASGTCFQITPRQTLDEPPKPLRCTGRRPSSSKRLIRRLHRPPAASQCGTLWPVDRGPVWRSIKTMNAVIQHELALLRTLHEQKDVPFRGNQPATEDEIRAAGQQIHFDIENGLRDLWLLCNGADYWMTFFGVFSDEPTPCRFLSVAEAVQRWQEFQGSIRDYEQDSPRDPRIRGGWSHPRWLPFAEFNGFSTCVMYDRAPNDGGTDGQIIVYQHDPDAIYWVARNFEEFFQQSNRIIEENDLIE